MSAKAAIDRPSLVILIAEDDPNDVLLLKRAFVRAGIGASLFFVSNGQEVINYLVGQAPYNDRRTHPYPNILLLDVNMPGLNGLEVLEWLSSRPERASLVAVIFSSCIAPADSQQAAMLGAHYCMTKPLDPSVLLPMISQLSPQPGADTPSSD